MQLAEPAFAPPHSDLSWTAPSRLSAVDRFFLPRIRDERDLHVVRTAARLTLRVMLPGLLLLVPGVFRWWMAPLWIAWLIPHFGPYVLMLHVVSHRPPFRKEAARWGWWVPYILGPFFGQSPGSYFVHHIGMHHAEENLLGDLSSTMGYRRDSLLHWLHYWLRFNLAGYWNLPRYFALRNKWKLGRRFLAGEATWWALFVAVGLLSGWPAACGVLLFPLMLIRTFFMSGNWAQHAFVDLDDPANPYKNSNNLINHRYNVRCFNDGYHVVHHIVAALHWSEMPGYYVDHVQEAQANDAIVFDGLGNNQTVWWCLMRGDYERLARHLVQWPGKERSLPERVEFLQSRVRPRQGGIPPLFLRAKDLAPPPGAAH